MQVYVKRQTESKCLMHFVLLLTTRSRALDGFYVAARPGRVGFLLNYVLPNSRSNPGLMNFFLPNRRLSRVSGDSHQREPILPCIYEGVPSQDPETLQQSAVDTLISRCGQKAVLLPHNGAAFSPLPDAQGPVASASFPIERQQPKGKGTSCLGRCSFKDNSAFQPNGDFPAQIKNASAFCSDSRAPHNSGSASALGSDRLCFCSDLQRYIQSHVLFPCVPLPVSGNFAAPPQYLPLPMFCFFLCSITFSPMLCFFLCSVIFSPIFCFLLCSITFSPRFCFPPCLGLS